jgi:transcriptional regulator with XRE-family HTH domain
MSGKKVKTSASSMSTPSAKRLIRKTQATPVRRGASQTAFGQAEVLSRPSSSPLADIYKTEEFQNEWGNNVRFHVARNLLHLRRYRRMSQSSVAATAGTSQSAIARIESAQENITVDTMERLIVALRGRFHISICPLEWPPLQPMPWWESADSPTWTLVNWTGRITGLTEQIILGLERRHDFTGATLAPTLTLPEGRTRIEDLP